MKSSRQRSGYLEGRTAAQHWLFLKEWLLPSEPHGWPSTLPGNWVWGLSHWLKSSCPALDSGLGPDWGEETTLQTSSESLP